MSRNSRSVLCCVSIISLFLAISPVLFAQSNAVLEKLPYSGGVLSARAIQAGKLVPHNGGFGLLSPVDLVCSPAPCVFNPVRASPGGQPANENPVAANPKNPLQFLSGANDYNCSNIQGYYSTNDGGNTWTHTCSPGSGGEGDPVVAYDTVGNAFAGGIQNGNFVIFISTDNGAHWSNPITVTKPLLGSLADKPWLEADVNPKSPRVNALYMSGTQFASNSNSEISVSHSNDAGQTWTTVVVDTEQIFPTAVDQFSDLAVGSDGTVYVSWLRCPATGPSGDCGDTTANMLLSKSTDGGNTWSTAVSIDTPKLAPDPGFCCFYGALPNTSERVSNIPSNAVAGSGANARVFVSYYTYTGGFLQVLLATSTDGGNTFGAAVPVSPASTDQFFQWVNTTSNGARTAVTWLDRRNDPADLTYQPFLALTANGVNFNTARPLSAAQSNPNNDGFGGTFMGDYRTHVWKGQSVYAVWMDTTTGTNNAQDEFGGAQVK